MDTVATPPAGVPHRKVVLLRGINVGKSARIPMADLRACTEAAGCAEVTTVLATGNVTVTDPRTVEELRTVLEAAYADRFGYDAVVQVLPLADLSVAVESYPFDVLADHHDYVVFSDDPAVTTRVATAMLEALDDPGAGTEAVAGGPGCVYWRVSRGATLTSAAAAVLDDRANRRHLTTRNIKTLRKILAAG
ncbi:DUF1697 domain-containing protein [Dietzia sp. UBA5065]|jgi:uncharacterized protein (DUF1697 family)|uniref:DUF1697 domain-containing protein n=1 Tax=Dietzia sp. UBA5065 TaxID=1946422 RepID=UPI0025BFAF2C|nr:DUF1697 domain-containing protein [Dietzia sp. UBA5065]